MRNPNKWRIEPGTDIITGQPKWFVTPPRFIYRPRGKRSFDTYDQALAHVRTSHGRRPLVFESKTHTGEYFWLNPSGASGWTKDLTEAHHLAGHTPVDVMA
ncbi:hypothetical protein ACFFGR_09445 [Arthrobacter liuii]|uniref:Uncharacterized protein n=1 Tax=Arthrobacter liuii TaxID=1476996 RepID=A0ABQ2APC6_9MICC|nr:hypothetical protein [Arthrobacter liuii]GGH93910.1 hypothetical protein GCM10007170_15880 [Arthrobacter liuii]